MLLLEYDLFFGSASMLPEFFISAGMGHRKQSIPLEKACPVNAHSKNNASFGADGCSPIAPATSNLTR